MSRLGVKDHSLRSSVFSLRGARDAEDGAQCSAPKTRPPPRAGPGGQYRDGLSPSLSSPVTVTPRRRTLSTSAWLCRTLVTRRVWRLATHTWTLYRPAEAVRRLRRGANAQAVSRRMRETPGVG
eukprot:scaffold8630_cov60-Phaeocystis_antarctica.AAC.1